MVENRHHTDFVKYFELAFGKRPARELYVLADDPDQINNRVGDPELAEVEEELYGRLMEELISKGDPRVTEDPVRYESLPFTASK
jgi:hypothetical protein